MKVRKLHDWEVGYRQAHLAVNRLRRGKISFC